MREERGYRGVRCFLTSHWPCAWIASVWYSVLAPRCCVYNIHVHVPRDIHVHVHVHVCMALHYRHACLAQCCFSLRCIHVHVSQYSGDSGNGSCIVYVVHILTIASILAILCSMQSCNLKIAQCIYAISRLRNVHVIMIECNLEIVQCTHAVLQMRIAQLRITRQ